MKFKRIIFIIFLLQLTPLLAYSQVEQVEADTASTEAEPPLKKGILRPVSWLVRYLKNSNKKTEKSSDFSVLAGPSYNSTTKLGFGGGVSGLYTWDHSDPTLQKSTFSAFFNVTVTGVVSLNLDGKNYMSHDRHRWNYRLEISRSPLDFWGIGYKNGVQNERRISNDMFRVKFQPDYLFRFGRALYAGPQMHLNYTNAYKVPRPEYLNGQDRTVFSLGLGAILQYDSRDFVMNATRGNYIRLVHLWYFKGLNKYPFNSTEFTFSTYRRMWKTGVVALDLHGMFNAGTDVPWTMLSMVGTGGRMRGYYEGRYRDRKIIEAQVEVRQHIWKRFGAAAWVGAANVFPDIGHIYYSQTLPSCGVGLRWEFKERLNIRIDVGLTKNKPGVEATFGEAF